MARKRMFDSEIISQDNFLELSTNAQALYFFLGMSADDEGFISPKKILRSYNIKESSLNELINADYLIRFNSGIVLIKDWYINNWLDKRRTKTTIYTEEKKLVEVNQETLKYQCLATAQPMLRKNNIDKNSIEEISIEENRRDEDIIEEIYYPELDDHIPYKEIIDYLNIKTNSNYYSTTEKTRACIKARWNEGFRLDDFKCVIDKKVNEWIGTDMEKYLRPITLFGTKFESYLNQIETKREITTKDIEKYIDWSDYMDE